MAAHALPYVALAFMFLTLLAAASIIMYAQSMRQQAAAAIAKGPPSKALAMALLASAPSRTRPWSKQASERLVQDFAARVPGVNVSVDTTAPHVKVVARTAMTPAVEAAVAHLQNNLGYKALPRDSGLTLIPPWDTNAELQIRSGPPLPAPTKSTMRALNALDAAFGSGHYILDK
jgi:hypothetical protein